MVHDLIEIGFVILFGWTIGSLVSDWFERKLDSVATEAYERGYRNGCQERRQAQEEPDEMQPAQSPEV